VGNEVGGDLVTEIDDPLLGESKVCDFTMYL
jgi:hypothetical protein